MRLTSWKRQNGLKQNGQIHLQLATGNDCGGAVNSSSFFIVSPSIADIAEGNEFVGIADYIVVVDIVDLSTD